MNGSDLSVAAAPFIHSFLFPPGSILLLGLGALLLMARGRLTFAIVVLGIALLLQYFSALPATHAWLYRQLAGGLDTVAVEHLATQAEAIVVLAGGRREAAAEYGGVDVPNHFSLQRARYGAYLQSQTGLPLLIAGGKVTPAAQTAEAELIRRVLENEWQVPVRWLEQTSRTTFDNAREVTRLLQKYGIERFALVTHAWHLPRARYAFRRFGMEPLAAPLELPAANSDGLTWQDWLPSARSQQAVSLKLHEWLGLQWYRLRFALGW